jgi:hypothetical protein
MNVDPIPARTEPHASTEAISTRADVLWDTPGSAARSTLTSVPAVRASPIPCAQCRRLTCIDVSAEMGCPGPTVTR